MVDLAVILELSQLVFKEKKVEFEEFKAGVPSLSNNDIELLPTT